MDQHVWLVSSLFALLVALVYRPDLILVCVVVVLTLACSALALSVSAQWYFDRKPSTPSNVNPPSRRELEALKRFMQELLPHSSGQGGRRLPVIFGRTLDDILQKLIDFTLRDFVQNWLEESGFGNTDQIIKDIKADLWKVIARLQERAARVDLAQLIAVDMISKVTAHFERLKVLQINHSNEAGLRGNDLFPGIKQFLIPLGFTGGALFFSAFNYLPARIRSLVLNSVSINQISDSNEISSLSVTTSDNLLTSPEAERQYLRKVAELCLMFLFSSEYMALDPVRHLLRELLVCKVFQPCIESLTDPDSINRKLLAYIEQQTAASAAAAAEVGTGGRSLIAEGYTPATSFEDLLLMIKQCQDIQVLKHIRYNIVTEIMQATASGGGGATRRYLLRLSQAQARCETRLQDLGESQDFRNRRKTPRSTNEGVEEATEAIQASKKLVGSPMMHVLASAEARIFLSEYLDSQQPEGEAGRQMLNFWETSEVLKSAASAEKHQLATEIFYTHVNAPNSAVLVEKGIRKRMESFLLGNGGPDAFFEVQSQMVANLEAKYWSGFSTSPQYTAMQSSLAERAQEASEAAFDDIDDIPEDYSKNAGGDAPTRSRTRLGRLQEKLDNKIQALEALRTSLKPESRILSALESEVDILKGELTQLQAHLTRTEVWSEHLGRWRAVVQSAEVSAEELQFVIVVHVAEDETDKEAVSSGWVVLRRLHHFLQLHRKLCQVNPAVKSFELPSAPLKFRLSKSATPASLEKATNQIQKYLKFVLEDDKLSASEALYAFLSPSSEHLKYGGNLTVSNFNSSEPKRNKKFSLATLFKVQELRDAFMTGGGGGGEENNSLLIEPTPGIATGSDGKDAIAEPLYSLLGEIFDLRGVFKWLRKTLITFVQITYGRTINRQVRETIAWMVSEPMAYYYVQTIIKTWWPGGKLTQHESTRTELQKEQTRSDARTQFLNNVPELLSSLVGQQNARRGAIKVFESLQHVEYNKHLFYELLDVVLTEIFPETKMD